MNFSSYILLLSFILAFSILSTIVSVAVLADSSSNSNWNCFAKMIITQIALDNLPSSSSSTKQQQKINKFQQAIDYQIMSTGLSSFAELPCWSSNITSILETHQQNFSQNQYSDWQRYVQCYGAKCPTNYQIQGDLVGVLADAVAGAQSAMNNQLIEGSSGVGTLGFWISMIAEMVASAHNPLQVCTLYNDQFPDNGGDHSGRRFMIKYGGSSSTTTQDTSLSSFVGSAAALLVDANNELEHPILDFPDQIARLNLYSNSLQNDLGASVTPQQKSETDVNKWISESMAVCIDSVYSNGKLVSGQAVTNEYVLGLRGALQRQMLLAGYHLSAFLIKNLLS